jgi:hypothetical protein
LSRDGIGREQETKQRRERCRDQQKASENERDPALSGRALFPVPPR